MKDDAMVEWFKAGKKEGNDHVEWDNEVWWGYWTQGDAGDGPLTPPDVMFPTREQAEAYAALIGKQFDTCVGPVLLNIQYRDNYDVPSCS